MVWKETVFSFHQGTVLGMVWDTEENHKPSWKATQIDLCLCGTCVSAKLHVTCLSKSEFHSIALESTFIAI
jgi:hypothetical protein